VRTLDIFADFIIFTVTQSHNDVGSDFTGFERQLFILFM
jgi:hypothetical protein